MSLRAIRAVSTGAMCAGGAALLYVAMVLVQAMDAASAAPEPFDLRQPRVVGQSLGHISIERIGLKAAITEGERASVLRRGVGHLSDTPWVGEGGNVALAGHRDTAFRPLRKIQPGDVVKITTAHREVRYAVVRVFVVPPSDVSVLGSSGKSTLTLITCYPFTFVGSAPDRFIVQAEEIAE